MSRNLLRLISITLLLFVSCNKNESSPISFQRYLLIDERILEKAECVKPNILIISQDSYFLLSFDEKIVVKISKDFSRIVKYAKQGQGPGEFVDPRGMTLFEDKIAILDVNKLILLDENLDFVRDLKSKDFVNLNFLTSKDKKFFAVYDGFKKKQLCIFDSKLKLIRKISLHDKRPIDIGYPDNYFYFFLAYPSKDKMVVSSLFYFNNENTEIDLLDLKSEKFIAKLKWQNKIYKTTKEQLVHRKNVYSFGGFAETQKYYVVNTLFYKNLRDFNSPPQSELIFFDKKNLKVVFRKEKSPFRINILAFDYDNNNRIYSLEEGGIYYYEIN